MSDDDKSMDVQLVYNQRVVTYNKLRGMNLIGFSDPWDNSIEIIAFYPVKMPGMNPMGISAPLGDSLGITSLPPVWKI